METWMSGGVGRAQGGYDEMVFRAMVQEDARFYDPLGLVSKGTEIDFKTGANAYLYGTRFMDYLGFTTARKNCSPGGDAMLTVAATTPRFSARVRLPLEESWRRWIAFEHGFQRQNLLAVREHPVSEYRDLTRRDLGRSRAPTSRGRTKLLAAVKYPGQLAHIVSIGRSDGRVTEIKEVKGASGYPTTLLLFLHPHQPSPSHTH